jgi:sulfonate transport system substrate-binding protein
MRARTVWCSLAVLALAVGRAEAEPLKVRVAWVAPLTDWASIWLEKKDLARHYGKSYVLEAVRYAGTPPMITAMANNELEIGSLAYSTLPISIVNAEARAAIATPIDPSPASAP